MRLLLNRIIITTLLLIVSAFSLLCQTPKENDSIEKQLRDLTSITSFTIDCSNEGSESQIALLSQLTSLTHLHIIRATQNDLFSRIDLPTSLVEIVIEESPELNYNRFLNNIGSKSQITHFSFNNCDLTTLPSSLKRYPNLTYLKSSANNGSEITSNLNVLKDLAAIDTLIWTDNLMTEFPFDPEPLRKVSYLDISGNNLSEIVINSFKSWRNLRHIDLSDNLITDPYASLQSLKVYKIETIILDGDGLTSNYMDSLKRIYPKSNYKFLSANSPQENTGEVDSILPVDTSELLSNINFGELKSSTPKVKVYSLAYLHYPGIFNQEKYLYSFDSSTFDERYADTTYINVKKRIPGNVYQDIELQLYPKRHKNEVWFEIKRHNYNWLWGYFPASNSRYLNRYHNEINAYRSMVFVSKEPLSRKEFKKRYVKNKYYTDFRLNYNENQALFTLEMKDQSGYHSISMFPRYKSESISLQKAQETYSKRNVRYQKSLDRRKKRFHRSLMKSKQYYERALQRSLALAWKEFQENYMSEDEKKMSKKQWLQYYDEVIANEKKALESATISMKNLEHSLLIEGYREISLPEMTARINSFEYRDVDFVDGLENKLAVANYLLINSESRQYTRFESDLGLGHNLMLNSDEENLLIIAELRNGDMAVVQPYSWYQFKASSKKLFKLKCELFESSLSHIGMLWGILDF